MKRETLIKVAGTIVYMVFMVPAFLGGWWWFLDVMFPTKPCAGPIIVNGEVITYKNNGKPIYVYEVCNN